jgi:hypothetical protein
MAGLSAQLVTLLGVVIGAGSSYLVTAAAERARWRRQTEIRWDERRATVYAEYGHSVIECVNLARRIAAGRGIQGFPHPVSLEDGRTDLSAARSQQGARWESVLLLGSPDAIEAGRRWQLRPLDTRCSRDNSTCSWSGATEHSWLSRFCSRARESDQVSRTHGLLTRSPGEGWRWRSWSR